MPRDAIQRSFNSVTAVVSGLFFLIHDEAKNVSRRCVNYHRRYLGTREHFVSVNYHCYFFAFRERHG